MSDSQSNLLTRVRAGGVVAAGLITGFSTLLFALVAFAYSQVADPVYEASIVLLPQTSESLNGGASLPSGLNTIAGLAGVNVGAEDRIKVEALATLRSRRFIVRFAKSHGVLEELFATDSPSDDDIFQTIVDDVVRIREDAVDGLVTLTVFWNSPELASNWANLLASDINMVMRARAREHALASIDYLEQELASTSSVPVQQAIAVLLEKQVTDIMMANVRPDFAFRVIDPAVPSDVDNPIFPKPILLTFAGGLFGFILAFSVLTLMYRNGSFD